MTLSSMRYKGYTWPHNPRVYSIAYQRRMAAHKTPFGLYQLQDLGREQRVMEGEGAFVGRDAYRQFGQLANVFYEKGPGLLVHPLWQASSAYFVSLRLEQEPRPDYVRYRFTFWEDNSGWSGLAQQAVDHGTAPGQAVRPAQGEGRYHQVVKGDTLWTIAGRYGLGLEELVALNPQIKNPNLIYPGEQVRLG